jgi:regulatory protein
MRLTLANEVARHKVIGRYVVPGNPNLIRVLFEDGEESTILIRDWVNFELKVNEPVENHIFHSVMKRGTIVQALNLAKRYLRLRVKTAEEVKRYLHGKGIEEHVVGEVLEQLKADRAVDDEQYSSMFISSKKNLLSPKALAHRLEQRGVDLDVIHKVMSENCDDEGEFQTATRVARRYLRSKPALVTREEKLKLAAHLARKGFSQSVAYKIMHNLDKFNE